MSPAMIAPSESMATPSRSRRPASCRIHGFVDAPESVERPILSFARAQSGREVASRAAFCERQGYFTRSPTPLSKMSPPRSQLNIWGSSLRITLSPSQEPTTTSGKPMAINMMLERS
jgi:hypothetical protein